MVPLLDLRDFQLVALVWLQLLRRHGFLRPVMHALEELGPFLIWPESLRAGLLKQLRRRIDYLLCLLQPLPECVREHCLKRDRAVGVSRGHVAGEFLALSESASAVLTFRHVVRLDRLFRLLWLLGFGLALLNDGDEALGLAGLI